MNKDMIRIEKMKEDRALLLKKVRDSIQDNAGHLSESIDQVITVLDFDDTCVKKYEAMKNAQELVASLTQEIVEAKTSDEVFNIRKKLNYYINKIKAEVKKRDVDVAIVEDYQEKVSNLRKDIAQYIRYLKREGISTEIDGYYNNYENLTAEELEQYKKLLKREISYNRKNLVGKKEVKAVPVVEESSSETVEENKTLVEETQEKIADGEASLNMDTQSVKEVLDAEDEFALPKSDRSEPQNADFDFDFPERKENTADLDSLKFQMPQGVFVRDPLPRSLDQVEFKDVSEYFNGRVAQFTHQYGVAPTYDYRRHSFCKNLINFFRNIPRYLHNKKSIELMKRDYSIFYRGNDLASYIEYCSRRNSIRQGLRCLFQRSYLYTRDNRYLNRHEKCSEWLYDFCKNNSMEISYQLEKSI